MDVQLRCAYRSAAREEIQRLPGAIARYQQAIMFSIDATPAGDTTPSPRRTVQVPRTFLRFEPISFIHLDDGANNGNADRADPVLPAR